MLGDQTWVPSPKIDFAVPKPILLTPGCGEGKYSVYCRAPNKENWQLMLKRTELSREGFLKATFGVRVAARGLSSDWFMVR